MEILVRALDLQGDAQSVSHVFEENKRDAELHLYPMGDGHVGSAVCDERRLKAWVDLVAGDPLGWALDSGDKTNAIHPNDAKRYQIDAVPDEVFRGKSHEIKRRLRDMSRYEADKYIEIMSPLKGRFLGMTWGNHERELQKRHNIDLHTYICDALEAPDLGDLGFINLVLRRGAEAKNNVRVFQIFMTHGCNSGRTAGAKNNSLARLANIFDADLIIQGHSHTPGHEIIPRIGATTGANPRIIERETRAVNVGSFTNIYQKGTVDYAATKIYNPQAKLHFRVDIRGFAGKHNMPVTRITEILR